MSDLAIIYGWSEGPWQAKRFRRAASKQGFTNTKDISTADVIVAHSAGCYLVPRDNRAKVILLIGTPLWPGRSLISSVLGNLNADFGLHTAGKTRVWWLTKLLHNSWYVLRRPSASWYVLTRHKVRNLPKPSEDQAIYFIRNSHDTFCKADAYKLIPQAAQYKILDLHGSHDDCWFNPQPYVDLVIKELK